MPKRVHYLIILIVLSAVMRWVYAGIQSQPIFNADSYGYYGFAKQILEKPTLSTFVNQYRVPVYPIILAGLMAVNQSKDIALDNSVFRPTLDQLILFQITLGIVGVVLVYFLLLQLSIPNLWAFLVSLFLSWNIYTYPLEHAVMTDSLACSLLVGMTYLLVQLVIKPKVRWYVLFTLLSAAGWLLRPNLLLVPLITLPFVFLSKENQKFRKVTIVTLAAMLLLPILFIILNAQLHGYTGISQINEINLLGRILEFDLPVEAGKRYTTYYNAVVDNKTRNKLTMPYRFIDVYTPLTYVDIKKMNELQKFDRAVIANNIPAYVSGTVSFIPKIFSDEPPLLAINTNATNGLAAFFSVVWRLYQMVWYSGYLVFVLFPISVWLFLRKKSANRMILVLLGAISVSQMLVIVFFDYYDPGQYARLASVIQPQTYLFLFLVMKELIHLGQKVGLHRMGV